MHGHRPRPSPGFSAHLTPHSATSIAIVYSVPTGKEENPEFLPLRKEDTGLASRGSALWVVFSCPLPSAQLETLTKTDLQERNKWTFISVCT